MDAPDQVPVHIRLVDPGRNRGQGIPSPSRLPRKFVENSRLLWSHRKLLRRVTLYAFGATILYSRTISDRLIELFQLNRVYHSKLIEDTRIALWEHVDISEERKSGVIGITVTDKDPRRAAGLAQAYVTELNRLVAEVSTSSARRERVFLEERLKTVKADLDNASKRFSEFASSNTATDVPAQGKAMVEAAAWIQGEVIFEESTLRGHEKIYAPANIRV